MEAPSPKLPAPRPARREALPALQGLLPEELATLLGPLGFSAVEARRAYAHHVQHDRAPWTIANLSRDKQARAQSIVSLPTRSSKLSASV